MRATRYPRPNGKAVNLLPSVPFPTVCIFDKYTPPKKRNYMKKPAKWEETGLTETSWLNRERAFKINKYIFKKSKETESAKCCTATIQILCHRISVNLLISLSLIMCLNNGLFNSLPSYMRGQTIDSEALIC